VAGGGVGGGAFAFTTSALNTLLRNRTGIRLWLSREISLKRSFKRSTETRSMAWGWTVGIVFNSSFFIFLT